MKRRTRGVAARPAKRRIRANESDGLTAEQWGESLSVLMPVEQLIPEEYNSWRPLIRECVAFAGSHLEPALLLQKMEEQAGLAPATPIEERIFVFVSHMPGFQKLGQVVARNKRLAPEVKAALSRLENGISDCTPAEIRSEIVAELGGLFETWSIQLADQMLAEASVSATWEFTWTHPVTNQPAQGVFKVLKPGVAQALFRDLNLFRQLASHVASRSTESGVGIASVPELLNEVCLLLEKEVDLRNEQRNLHEAVQRYSAFAGVRVPRPIPELSNSSITAMSREYGVKVTEAFVNQRKCREHARRQVIEAMLAMPVLANVNAPVFHADPHAGNIFYNEHTAEVVILDWALVQQMEPGEWSQVLMLFSTLLLRDETSASESIARLAGIELAAEPSKAALINSELERFFDDMPPWRVPGLRSVVGLLDRLTLRGISFSSSLLIFRKLLFTLFGVLADVEPRRGIDLPLIRYLAGQLVNPGSPARHLPLSRDDSRSLKFSALLFGSRFWSHAAFYSGVRLRSWVGQRLGELG